MAQTPKKTATKKPAAARTAKPAEAEAPKRSKEEIEAEEMRVRNANRGF